MPKCKICDNNISPFIMNNRLVCMHCDELLFDIEIERDETEEEHLIDKSEEKRSDGAVK